MKSLPEIRLYIIGLILFAFTSGCQGFFVSSGPGQPVEEVDTGCAYFYFLWGRQAELSYQFAEALEAYQKALICDPEAEYISRKIPVLLLRLDRGKEAVGLLEKYLADNPTDTTFRMLLARVYIGLEEYDAAAEEYKIIHRQDPSEIHSLLLLSELYLNRNMLQEAEQALQEVLSVKPDSYPALVLLARIYFNKEEYEQALSMYDKALEVNWSSDLLMEKADIYREQGQIEKIVALYRSILEQEKDNERAALSLVNLLLREKREAEALEVLNKFKDTSDLNENVELSVARLYARMGKNREAIDILRNSLKKKHDGDVRYFLAIILVQAEEYEQALSEAQMISRYDKEYENSIILQVRILRYLDRDEDAIELLEKAIADEEVHTPDMYVMLAAMYQLQNKAKMGEKTFDRAISAFPDDNELLYEYGLYLGSTGREEEAISVMEKVIKKQPSHGEALNYIGYYWADRNIHLDKALEYIQKAVTLKPESAYILDSLGWVYYRLGRNEQAREALEQAVELSADEPDPTVFDHLGDVYLELNRKEDALNAYQQGYDLFQENQQSELKEALQKKMQLLREQEVK